MSLLPATQRDPMIVTARRLELKYVGWPGDWDSFVEHISERGTLEEQEALARAPKEFQARAIERAARIDTALINRTEEMLENLAELALRSTKTCMKTGDTIPDNPTRLKATTAWLDLSLRLSPRSEEGSPGTAVAKNLRDIQERKHEIQRILGEGRVASIQETTRTVTFKKAPEEEEGPL